MIKQYKALDKTVSDNIPWKVEIKIHVHTYYIYNVQLSGHLDACKELTNDVLINRAYAK